MRYVLVGLGCLLVFYLTLRAMKQYNASKVLERQNKRKNQHSEKKKGMVNRAKPQTAPKRYSGNLHPISSQDYKRFILVKNTSESYFLEMLREYVKWLPGENEWTVQIAATEAWFVVKVPESLSFYHYHNLTSWLHGYEANTHTPQFSIGFAIHQSDKKQNYLTYIDSDFEEHDTLLGVFDNQESFFIYLPNADATNGNLSISEELHISSQEMKDFLIQNGIKPKGIASLRFKDVVV